MTVKEMAEKNKKFCRIYSASAKDGCASCPLYYINGSCFSNLEDEESIRTKYKFLVSEGYIDECDESVNDPVNHPSHYTQGGIECIEAMESAFGKEELAVYCKIAAFKYIWRCEHKNGLEDIEKAVFYLQKYIDIKKGEKDAEET